MICGEKKTYSKRYYIDVKRALKELSLEDWTNWVNSVFTESDAKALITWRSNAEQTGNWILPKSFDSGIVQKTNDVAFSEIKRFEEKTVMEYLNDYGGNPKSDSVDLQTSVNTELVFTLVYDPKSKVYFHPNDNDSAHLGYTVINYRLRKRKESLAKQLMELLNIQEIPYQFDNDESFTNFINTVLLNAQSELIKMTYRKGATISPELRNTFIKLAAFDELLFNSKFVKLNPESRSDFVLAKDKYLFTGEQIDYSKSMFEEHANSEDYTSKLVKIILDSIDCLTGPDGSPTGVKLGLGGFEYAMSEVIDYALSGKNPMMWEIATDDNVSDFATMIDVYLSLNNPPKTIKSALHGIRKSLFEKDVPRVIQEMFNAQALSFVRSIYIEYKFGSFTKNKKKIPGIVATEAVDKVTDQIKNRLVDKMITKIEILSKNPDHWVKLKSKLDLKYDQNTNSISFKLFPNGERIILTYNTIDKKFIFQNAPQSATDNPIWIKLFHTLLDLPLTNSSECNRILNEMREVSIFSVFDQMFGAVLWSLESNANDKGSYWRQNGNPSGDFVWSMLYRFAENGSVFMKKVLTDEFKSIVKDQNGNNIPPYQMMSLAYRTPHLIRSIVEDIKEGRENVKSNNFWVEHKTNLGSTSLRESVKVGNKVKNVSDMSTNEVLQIAILTDYLQKLNSDHSINLQPMTYSDKTRHMLKEILLSGMTIDGKRAEDLFKTLNDNFAFGKNGQKVVDAENTLIEEIRKRRFSEAEKTLRLKLFRFAKVYGLNTNVSLEELLNNVNGIISTKKEFEIREDFRRRKVDFYTENDIDKTKTGSIINEMLVNSYRIYKDFESTKAYLERMKIESALDLYHSGFKLNRFLDPYLQEYYKTLGSDAKNWVNSNSGTIELFKVRDHSGNEVPFNPEWSIEEILSTGTIELCPVINGYFFANALFSEQIRSLHMGADYNIKGSGGDFENDVASRFIAQSKRAMGQGSTVLKLDTTRQFGVGSKGRMMDIEDLRRFVFNPQGNTKNELINDGAGYLSPEQFILECWSVPGNVSPRGDVVKSIMQFVDSEGSLQQFKWAATVMSNLRMRGTYGDSFSIKEMYRRTHSDQIHTSFDIKSFYGDSLYSLNGRPITCTEKLYFKDNETGKYWRIESVENVGPNRIKRTVSEVTANGNLTGVVTSEEFDVNSIYDLFVLFGGEWCMTYNQRQKTLDYTEMNHEILANIICVNEFKDKFVGYVTNISAHKVGMKNVNNANSFENPIYRIQRLKKQLKDYFKSFPDMLPEELLGDPNTIDVFKEKDVIEMCKRYNIDSEDLWTYEIELSHSGWQLDAGHEVKDGHVTEMSQLVALLIEKGYCTDLVANIYNNIAKVTKAGLEKFEDQERLNEIISEVLIFSLKNTNSNITSITDDFIKHLETRVREEGIALELPFSSPSIRSKFATSICATINSAALRRKYSGLGTVQTPSVGQMTTSNIGGFDFTYEQTCDLYRDSLKESGYTSMDDLFVDKNSPNPKSEVTFEYLANMMGVSATISPYNEESYTVSVIEEILPADITFQDTIIVPTYDLEGKLHYEIIKINDISTRDRYKHLLSSGVKVYRWNTRPRDLVQQLSTYTTGDGFVFDIYDLDESRLVFYLSHPDVWIKWSLDEQQRIKDFIKLKTGKDFNNLSPELILAELTKSKQALQEKMERLDEGDTQIFVDGIVRDIINVWNKGADIMVGNPYFEKFGMTGRESVSDILLKGPKFFKDKLVKRYSIPEDVPNTQFDAVLYAEDGEKILIQFGNNPRRNNDSIHKGNSFTKTTGKLIYKGEDLGSSNGVQEFVYKGGSGTYYKVLQLNDPSILNRLRKSKMFTDVRYVASNESDFTTLCKIKYGKFVDNNGYARKTFKIGNFIIEQGSKISKVFEKYSKKLIPAFNVDRAFELDRKFEKLSERQYIAFRQSLECVGTRIPSQALQSCAKCRIIGFTGSKTNDVYVPQVLTWVAGSDFDIDKFFIMMYDIMDDGTLPNIYGITNPHFNPVDLGKLKDGVGKEFDIFIQNSIPDEENLIGNEIFVTKEDIIAINRGDFNRLSNIIERITSNSEIIVIDPSVKASDMQMIGAATGLEIYELSDVSDRTYRNEIENFYDTINEWSTNDLSKYAKRYRDAAERNQVASSIMHALSQNSVQIALQNPISMDDAHNAADMIDAKGESKIVMKLNNDNIYSRFKQQEDNMVGKIGIASVAVAQKAFNGISFSFNFIANKLGEELKTIDLADSDVRINWEKRLLDICIEKKDKKTGLWDGTYTSLANINFRKLLRLIREQKTNPNLTPEVKLWLEKQETIVKGLHRNANATDAVNLFSNLMSAATDNAKELLLARLNAIGSNIDLYTFLFAKGYTFAEAADKMSSKTFDLVNYFMKQNVFELGSDRLRLNGVIDFIRDQAYLPTVNKQIVKSIFKNLNGNSFFNLLLNNAENISEIKTFILSYLNNTIPGAQFTDIAGIKEEMQNRDSIVLQTLMSPHNNSKLTKLEHLQLQLLKLDIVRELFTGLDGWLVKQIKARDNNTSMYSERDDIDDGASDDLNEQASQYIYRQHGYTDASADELRQVYNYFVNNVYYKHDHFNESQNNELKELLEITRGADEFAILGRKIFSINQGMRVGDYEEYSWIESINTSINRKFYEIFKDRGVTSFYKFDFIKFMTDDVYADLMCDEYDKVKSTVNILRVLRQSPHYKAMINAALTARKLIEQSFIAKETRSVAKQLMNGVMDSEHFQILDSDVIKQEVNPITGDVKRHWTAERIIISDRNAEMCIRNLSAFEFNKIAECINEHMILNFFLNLEDRIKIPIDSTQISTKYTVNKDGLQYKSVVKANDSFTLNSIDGLATFKVWMDTFFIPKLKETLSAGKYNAFADFLIQTSIENETYGTKKYVWNIDRDVKGAVPGETLYKKKADVIAAFNEIIQVPLSNILGSNYAQTNVSVGDLLYLYNLYTFKGSGVGMDFLFADAAASGNKSEWVNNFQRYVKQLDYGEITEKEGKPLFNVTVKDVLSKVITEENAWKFNVNFNPNNEEGVIRGYDSTFSIGRPDFINNSDITFEIGSAYDGIRTSEWDGFDPYEYFKFDSNGKIVNRKIKVNGTEVMYTIIDKLNVVLKAAGITVIDYSKRDVELWQKRGDSIVEGISEDELNRIKDGRGFVYDGKIYINVDESIKNLSTTDPSFSKILIHELVHIIAANLHYNPKYSKTYGQILDRLWKDVPNEVKEEYKRKYPNKKTTDLKEEYFAEFIADMFDKKLRQSVGQRWTSATEGVPEIENITVDQLQYDIKETLKDIFELDDSFDDADFSKVLGTELTQILGMFNSALFDFTKLGFTTNVVELSQELATIKNNLFNKNKILEDCK